MLQLAVVVFIIAIVIGLMLPAVERVRGAAARMKCLDKLKQLACAAHNYASTYEDSLPPGSVVGSAKEPADRLGVLVALMPFVEQDSLYKSLDLTKGWEEQKGTDVALRVYRCPINSRPDTAKHTNYVAIAGVDPDAASLPLEDKRAGAFGFARVVRLKDIKDGTSNTLLFMETHHETGPWASATATLRGIDPDDETPVGKGRTFGVDHAAGAWSWWGRPGECNAAMADGSVRTMKATISAEVLSVLATVAGGEEIPAEW
jgi:hypothetical protein